MQPSSPDRDKRSGPKALGRSAGYVQRSLVGNRPVILRVSVNNTGRVTEIIIEAPGVPAAVQGWLTCFSKAVSIGLQHGVPLETYVDEFIFCEFGPAGSVHGHATLRTATSIVDFVFRDIAISCLNRADLGHRAPIGPKANE